MTLDQLPGPMSGKSIGDSKTAVTRWARLADDFARLPCVVSISTDGALLRDVGALLLLGHDDVLAEAERYIVIGHTMRTGQVVDFDDIDDAEALARWVRELDRASAEGYAPPVPEGFWASFLRWRTPLGMARLTDRRMRRSDAAPVHTSATDPVPRG